MTSVKTSYSYNLSWTNVLNIFSLISKAMFGLTFREMLNSPLHKPRAYGYKEGTRFQWKDLCHRFGV